MSNGKTGSNETAIDVEIMRAAIGFMRHAIEAKMVMLGEHTGVAEEEVPVASQPATPHIVNPANFVRDNGKLIVRVVLNSDKDLPAYKVSANHMMPPWFNSSATKYSTSQAIQWLRKLEKLGFGQLHPGNRNSVSFCRHDWSDLSPEAIDSLGALGFTADYVITKKSRN